MNPRCYASLFRVPKNKTVALPPTVLASWGVLGFGPELSSKKVV